MARHQINVFLSDYGLSTQYSTDATHVYVYTQQAVNKQITKVTNSTAVDSEINSARYDLYTYGVYDVASAVAYMTNTEYNTGDEPKAEDTSIYNKKDYDRFASDCANFVAQGLVAGGVKMNKDFYYTRDLGKIISGLEDGVSLQYINKYRKYNSEWSNIWSVACNQFEYFSNKNNGYTKSDVLIISNKDDKAKYINDIRVGDLCYFDIPSHGNPADGKVEHATMITEISGDTIKYSAHNSNRINNPITFNTNGAFDDGTIVYIIKMNR